jgi:hypothetical protein
VWLVGTAQWIAENPRPNAERHENSKVEECHQDTALNVTDYRTNEAKAMPGNMNDFPQITPLGTLHVAVNIVYASIGCQWGNMRDCLKA